MGKSTVLHLFIITFKKPLTTGELSPVKNSSIIFILDYVSYRKKKSVKNDQTFAK